MTALSPPVPAPHVPLPSIPGGWATQAFTLADRELRLTLPASPDAFLDDPHVQELHLQDGYMPYWSYLWPASLEMAQEILRTQWPAGATMLEIGAGIGLTGIAGRAAGLVTTISDYDRQSIELALYNARQNGFADVEGLVLDWRHPIERRFRYVFGCDVIYERRNHEPILSLLEVMLEPGGECWLADPGRHRADDFVADARSRGWECACRPIPRLPYPDRPEGHTNIWVLTRRR